MKTIFSDRIVDVPRSFIREILKVSQNPEIISFAGGLPNKDLFPVEAIEKATERVFKLHGSECLQYSNSEGYIKLRQFIAKRYLDKKNIKIDPENILITNGAQQGLDLISKVLLNDGDGVVVEEPAYLGALQSFSIFKPEFRSYQVGEDGMNRSQLEEAVNHKGTKLMYTVPNFQNPSGLTYSEEDRQRICESISGKNLYIIEDDPYGELRFSGSTKPSFYSYLPEQTIMLGSFSKTVIPGFRIGWVVAPTEIQQKLLIAKQAADLHTCHFTQYILYQFFKENDIDEHIDTIINAYGSQCRAMIRCMDEILPDTITFTKPEGGMFLWAELPKGLDAMDLFNLAVEEKVVFVPGAPFYHTCESSPSFRLSFSCVDEPTIKEGILRLSKAVKRLIAV